MNDRGGTKFWFQKLTDLRNRRVKDILIASIDGLKGFTEAIEVTFEKPRFNSTSFTRLETRSNTLPERTTRPSSGI
ncbi:MAG: transposase [Spirochaetes bacterium]|nr:transposase [Spirochaetota bacterium]